MIISHGNFMESLAALKTHRESQGLSVALIDVEDIYDEFSYGTKTPQAIKDFLTRASTSWQTPPRFVLLVGDASFDPRNYLGLGNQDFLPTKFSIRRTWRPPRMTGSWTSMETVYRIWP